MGFGQLCRDATGIGKHLPIHQRQKAVQPFLPVLHRHGDMAHGLYLRQIEVGRNNAAKRLQLLLRKVVFGNRHVVFMNFARRRTLPCRQTHVFLVGVGTLIDQLRRRVPMHAVMHLVLHRREKALGGLCRRIVIDGRSVNVRNLLVETTFRQTNLADALQLFLEIVLRKHSTAPFQPLVVHHPSLYGVVLDNRIRPLAELYGTLVIDLEAHGDNHLETIMFHFAADLTAAFGLNYPEIPDSCRLGQFIVVVNLPDMLVDGTYIHAIQLRHHSLSQPNVFILIPEFHAGGIFTRSRHEGQVFGGRTADRYLFIAHTHSFLQCGHNRVDSRAQHVLTCDNLCNTQVQCLYIYLLARIGLFDV